MRALLGLDGDLGAAEGAFFGGGGGGRLFLLLVGELGDGVHGLDQRKDDDGHDEEVDDGRDETAVVEGGGAGFLGGFEGGVGVAVEGDEEVGEIHLAGEQCQAGHDDVVDQRVDDGFEGGTDDDTDGHIQHVAAADKFLEFVD